MSFHERTTDAAHGRWKGILLELGVPEKALTGRHTACPMCGGNDRFRFDNKQGSGSWICNSCGAGNGMDLAMKYTQEDFKTCAGVIDDILGNKKVGEDEIAPQVDEAKRKSILRKVYSDSKPVQFGDLAHRYMSKRCIEADKYSSVLRFIQSTVDGEGGLRPAILATVSDPDGKPVTIHRTFLDPETSDKAIMQSPRKMMPGEVPEGSSIRLYPWSCGALGVAEGWETARAAAKTFQMPVWSVIDAGKMEKWIPPEGCSHVVIFGDKDANFRGQAAAYSLGYRLASRLEKVSVSLPPIIGDWNDVLLRPRDVISALPESAQIELDERISMMQGAPNAERSALVEYLRNGEVNAKLD